MERQTYADAAQPSDAALWKLDMVAIDEEMTPLEENSTRTLECYPTGVNLAQGHVDFKFKQDAWVIAGQYKARLGV